MLIQTSFEAFNADFLGAGFFHTSIHSLCLTVLSGKDVQMYFILIIPLGCVHFASQPLIFALGMVVLYPVWAIDFAMNDWYTRAKRRAHLL